MTKRSDRVMGDLVDLVGPLKTRGLNGSVIADTSYEVGFEVLEVSRMNWESLDVIVGVVAGFDIDVWGDLVIEVVASSLVGDRLCDVTTDGTSSKGDLFNAGGVSRGSSKVSQT